MSDPTSALSASSAVRTVNRTQLSMELGRSRTWLDQRIATDPDFPILQRGGQGQAYAFDLAAVQAYLQGQDTTASKLPAVTSQGRLAEAKARMAEMDVSDRMSKLVDVEGMRALVGKASGDLRMILDKTVGELTRRHGFSVAVEREIAASMGALVDDLEADIGEALSPGNKRLLEEHPGLN
jgi:phage terminase Nu1 subunit (DNA packaging protein)